MSFADQLMWFDAPLIDTRVLHQIITHKDTKKIILFLGSGHTYNIGIILERLLGYRKIAHVGKHVEYPLLEISFDKLSSDAKPKKTTIMRPLETHEFKIIGADDPEKLSA